MPTAISALMKTAPTQIPAMAPVESVACLVCRTAESAGAEVEGIVRLIETAVEADEIVEVDCVASESDLRRCH
jgi:hypothetical protein